MIRRNARGFLIPVCLGAYELVSEGIEQGFNEFEGICGSRRPSSMLGHQAFGQILGRETPDSLTLSCENLGFRVSVVR